jgi:hypothetical protein
MPFAKSCRITLTNEGGVAVDHVYYHVDWQKERALPPDTLLLPRALQAGAARAGGEAQLHVSST